MAICDSIGKDDAIYMYRNKHATYDINKNTFQHEYTFYCITYPPRAVVFFAVHLEKTIIADNVAGHVFLVINFPFYGHISGYIFICLLPHALELIQEKLNVYFHFIRIVTNSGY